MEKLKIVLYSAYQVLLDVVYFFTVLWKMALSFIDCQFRLLFNVAFNRKLFPLKDLMNFNFGIAFLITLLCTAGSISSIPVAERIILSFWMDIANFLNIEFILLSIHFSSDLIIKERRLRVSTILGLYDSFSKGIN